VLNPGDGDGASYSEISYDGVALRQENVFGLDVSVNDSLAVCVRESVGDFAPDAHRCLDRQLALARYTEAKSLAADVRHQVVQHRLHVPGVEERQYVGMLEASERPDLSDETNLASLGVRISVEDLERYLPLVPGVVDEIDRRESALTDLALDLVPGSQGSAQWGERILRGGRSCHAAPQTDSPFAKNEQENFVKRMPEPRSAKLGKHKLTLSLEP